MELSLLPHPGRPVLASPGSPTPEALVDSPNNQASKAAASCTQAELLILALRHYFLHFLLLKYFEFLIHY